MCVHRSHSFPSECRRLTRMGVIASTRIHVKHVTLTGAGTCTKYQEETYEGKADSYSARQHLCLLTSNSCVEMVFLNARSQRLKDHEPDERSSVQKKKRADACISRLGFVLVILPKLEEVAKEAVVPFSLTVSEVLGRPKLV